MIRRRLAQQHTYGPGWLGRHVVHDPRSRAFAVEPAPGEEIRSVRHHRLVGPYDQGPLGSCTAQAICGAMSTRPFGHHFRSQRTMRGVYHDETVADDFDGTWPPDDTGSSGLAACKVAQARGWISEYRHAFSLEAALTALQAGPVVTGITWLTGCDTPDDNGVIRWTGRERGGHELVLDEVDITREMVGGTNSWGPGWGLAGRFYLPFADYERALDDQGDVTVPVAA